MAGLYLLEHPLLRDNDKKKFYNSLLVDSFEPFSDEEAEDLNKIFTKKNHE